jgi:processive 1,2-diacylglycerol beta-glucosyltransferase
MAPVHPPRTMILSGPIGNGHAAVADACAAALSTAGADSRTLDSLSLMGQRRTRLGVALFKAAMHSSLYDTFHFGHLHLCDRCCRAITAKTLDGAYPALRAAARAFEPEIVLAVFSTGVALAERLKDEGACERAEVLIPDAVAHQLWVAPGIDRYLVTSPLTAASVRRYQPRARTTVIDLPLRSDFGHPPAQDAARSGLGVPDDVPCTLLAAGGWGSAPLDRLAQALADSGDWVLVLAGRNQRLLQRLATLRESHPTVVPIGFSADVCSLIAASDVVVTAPGVTCAEARAVGRPLVLLDVLPGHGRENLQHELELGGAEVASGDARGLVAAVAATRDRWSTTTGLREGPGRSFLSVFASVPGDVPGSRP